MKKSRAFHFLLIACMLVATLLISGCGSSNKMLGTWINIKENNSLPSDRIIKVLTIEKNGDNIIVNSNRYIIKVGYGYGDFESKSVGQNTNQYDLNYGIRKKDRKFIGTENKGIIHANYQGDSLTLTYVEKDNTILEGNDTYKKLENKTVDQLINEIEHQIVEKNKELVEKNNQNPNRKETVIINSTKFEGKSID